MQSCKLAVGRERARGQQVGPLEGRSLMSSRRATESRMGIESSTSEAARETMC